MAETAVKSAANWMGKLLIEEAKFLWGAEKKMEELRNELLWMQCFLRSADNTKDDDEIVRMWVFQIKDYVAEAEDIIDNFLIKVASRRRHTDWKNKLKRYSCFLGELIDLHQVTSSIDSLKADISLLSPRLEKYGLKTSFGVKTYHSREALLQESLKYRHLEKENIVGLEADAHKIMDELRKWKSARKVVSIYGMGGLGKTTLATKVYHHDDIKRHFRGGQAWAYISRQLQIQSVLQILLADLTLESTETFCQKGVKELVSELCEFLKNNRCLVVLDDVWNQHDWDILKAAFTSCGGESGSKVLLTTRKEEVAKYVDQHALNKPDPLSNKPASQLLLQTVGWLGTEDDGSDKEVSNLFELGEKMVEHCNGLPLAIIALGGILRKKETVDEWYMVQNNIKSYLRKGCDHGRSYTEVLVQSYNDLPYHLKPCFLHLGNFPEDYEIKTEKLYWMWMAEGLLTRPHDRIAGTESLEDVGNDYMSDLARAGMVEIMKKRSDGRIKSIRLHDLMRDVCLQKAAADNFLNVIDHRPCLDKPLNISSNSSHKRLFRMAIYLGQGVKSVVPDALFSKAHTYIRSMLLIAGREAEAVQDEVGSNPASLVTKFHSWLLRSMAGCGGQHNKSQHWFEHICDEFQWLRILDVEGFCLEGKLPKQIENLVHLRYLSLKETKVSELSSSIGNLRLLETLDLRVSDAVSSVKIPNSLWKLDHLRHLLLPSVTYEVKGSEKLRLDTLGCLEILRNLEVSISHLEDLQKLEKMRNISFKGTISDMESLNLIFQFPAVRSGTLQRCSLAAKGNLIGENPNILASCRCIHRLKLVEQIAVCAEDVVTFPHFLKALNLESCRLENDPMGILGGLRHLKDLFLGTNSFIGTEMKCVSESFPVLTNLHLLGLVNLELWTVEKGSMPKLKVLRIWNCDNLKSIPKVLPPLLHVTCSPCISGIEIYGTCIFYKGSSSIGCSCLEDVFGRDHDIDLLSGQLLLDTCKKIFLTGKAGIGKATLAKELYFHPSIRRHFDASAWTYLPSLMTRAFHRRTLQKLFSDLAPEMDTERLHQKSYDDLTKEIQRVVKLKKCLVILTYLGKVDLGFLEAVFGRHCLESGSKLLIISNTTPYTKLSDHFLHEVKEPDFNWRSSLFDKGSKIILDGVDASRLELMKAGMLHSSSHDPLSIRMLAGLMEMKLTLLQWTTIHEEFTVRCHYPDSKIFVLSYKDLKPDLRHCFLYLGSFPNDIEIPTAKIYQMWIATGLVRLKDDQVLPDEFLENLAESYLSELIQRGLVKACQRGSSGRIKTCRLQFGIYHLCLEKAREEHFLAIIDQTGSSDPDEDTHSPSASASTTKLTVQHLAVRMDEDKNSIFPAQASSNQQLSSLLYFANYSDPQFKKENWGWFISICDCFRSLLVLDLEGMRTTSGSLPSEVGNMTQLRYLSLKGTWVTKLPPSIEKLNKLQTLDLRVSGPLNIPDVLWKLKFLRHLYLPECTAREPEKLQLHSLEHLQTLANLHTGEVHLNHLPGLRFLRKISLRKIHDVEEFDSVLRSVSTSLDLSLTVNSEIINGNPAILSRFKSLYKVRIKGRISNSTGIEAQMVPANLEELTLKHTKLEQDPVPELQKLGQLKRLFFDHDSFLGKKMTFSGEYTSLSHLKFRSLSNLEELSNPEGDMNYLDSLMIINCRRIQDDKVELYSDDDPKIIFN